MAARLLISFALAALWHQTAAMRLEGIEHIVVFGIDGLARRPYEEALASGQLPNLQSIKNRGAFTRSARSVMPLVSYPNWASILTGVDTPFHGIDGNEWTPTHPKVIGPDGPCAKTPNVFSVVRRLRPNATLAAFYRWTAIGDILEPSIHLNVSRFDVTEQESTTAAADYIRSARPLLTFLYLEGIDDAGHKYGFGKEYTDAIKTVDAQVGQILNALAESGIFDKTLVITVTDHGRKDPAGKFHGSFTQEEVNTYWMMAGPGVKQNYEIVSPVANADTAPTVLAALGLQPPVQMRARPITEAFEDTAIATHPDAKNASIVGWSYAESIPIDAQCIADFKLDVPVIWGVWDNASFGIGAAIGVIVETVLLALGVVIWRYRQDRMQKRQMALFEPLVSSTARLS